VVEFDLNSTWFLHVICIEGINRDTLKLLEQNMMNLMYFLLLTSTLVTTALSKHRIANSDWRLSGDKRNFITSSRAQS